MPRNLGDRETTQFDRGRIIALREAGMSERGTARELGLSRSTVRRWTIRWRESGDVNNAPRHGRPKVTIPQQDAEIVATVQRQPVTNACAVQRELQVECSDATVRR